MSQTFKMILDISLSLFIPRLKKRYYLQFNAMKEIFKRLKNILTLFLPHHFSLLPSLPPSFPVFHLPLPPYTGNTFWKDSHQTANIDFL